MESSVVLVMRDEGCSTVYGGEDRLTLVAAKDWTKKRTWQRMPGSMFGGVGSLLRRSRAGGLEFELLVPVMGTRFSRSRLPPAKSLRTISPSCPIKI